MNYQEIFKIAILLISSPTKAWEEIRLQEDRGKVLLGFVYPMIGLCSLSVFLGTLFTHGWSGPESFQLAMIKCAVVAVTLFGGFYLAAYLVNLLGINVFKLPDNIILSQLFTGYALVVTFIIYIITGFFPELSFLAIILQLYIIYIVWEGSPLIMEITENIRLKYTLLISAVVIFCPWLIHVIFNLLLIILD